MKKINRQKGQLLIEAIVAMTLVGIIITGLVIALTYSVNNTNISRDQSLATSYAQEGLDVARNIKDSDFNSFSVLNGFYYLPSGSTSISSSNPSTLIDGKFLRQIYINQSGIDGRNGVQVCTGGTAAFVVSIVTWTDNRCTTGAKCHNTELNTCFTDPSKLLY